MNQDLININYKRKFTYLIVMFLVIIKILVPMKATAEFLTMEEKTYIKENQRIKVATVRGAAPISYVDSSNNLRGISKRVLDEVAHRTGLVFEYFIYDSVEEVLLSDADVICGISPTYAPENMQLTRPFLRSETVLYMNLSLQVENLGDKKYAAVEGSDLPEDVQEQNVIYFKTREESMTAVDKGIADYGYGNAYSVAYYTIRNGYNKIITIPQGKETREYCVGLLHGDEILLEIIDKTIGMIDETQMQMLVLDVASHIERNITLELIMHTYGKEIILSVSVIISILVLSICSTVNSKRKLKKLNKILMAKAQKDGLTGLYNAVTVKELINERINSKNNKSVDAFILIDCDDFKNINDTYGHLYGNTYLENLSHILRKIFRGTDIIGRLGGDEFCVYLTNVTSIESVNKQCMQINSQLKNAKIEVRSSVSVGIAVVNDMDSYEDVFKNADSALYKAKNNGKAQLVQQ